MAEPSRWLGCSFNLPSDGPGEAEFLFGADIGRWHCPIVDSGATKP